MFSSLFSSFSPKDGAHSEKRVRAVFFCVRLSVQDTIRPHGIFVAFCGGVKSRRNGLRCVALFLRLRTAPRTGLRRRAGWLRLRAGRPRAARPEGLRAARAAGAVRAVKRDGATDCGAVAARRFARVHRFGNAPSRRCPGGRAEKLWVRQRYGSREEKRDKSRLGESRLRGRRGSCCNSADRGQAERQGIERIKLVRSVEFFVVFAATALRLAAAAGRIRGG